MYHNYPLKALLPTMKHFNFFRQNHLKLIQILARTKSISDAISDKYNEYIINRLCLLSFLKNFVEIEAQLLLPGIVTHFR